MAYMTRAELEAMGFAALGREVRVSTRAAIYEPEKIRLGDLCRIDDFCVVSGRVEIGRNVHVAVQCSVSGGAPGIVLEDFAGLAYGCHVFAQSDDYSGRSLTNPTVPREFKAEILRPLRIGRHAILGAGAVVMPGADVAEGCAVGAGAVVVRPTEPWGIYVGVPARRAGERSRELLTLEKEYLAREGAADG